mgnify:CR=1 FL=1
MPAVIVIILGWFSRYLIFTVFKYVFTGFLGIVSYAFMQRLIDRYINAGLAELLNSDAVAPIMHISRLDDAISIIVGGMAICASIKALGITITSVSA